MSSARADLHPPGDVLWIARRLEEAGHEAWAVGGAVRDALAGGSPDDWDLATSARPVDVRRIFRRTVPLGIEHGTVGVVASSGVMYEVTTFRRDVETFGRRARVAFADRIEDDLSRRDFTMNAIAWHPTTGELLDPYLGLDDLRAGILRTVGEPDRRFEEDRLRVLRALRFAGTFSLSIEPDTWAAVVASSDKLGGLSPERVREELRKVLAGQPDPSLSLRLYAESGVLRHLYPELDRCRQEGVDEADSVWGIQVRAAAGAAPARLRVRLAALLHDVGSCADRVETNDPRGASGVAGPHSSALPSAVAARSAAIARDLLRRLRFSNADVDHVTHLIAQRLPLPSPDAPAAELRRWIRRIGPEILNDSLRLQFAIARARGKVASGGAGAHTGPGVASQQLRALRSRAATILATHPPLRITDLAIGGTDLRAIGLAPGPRYREILDHLLERVMDDPELNQPDVLLRIARSVAGSDRLPP